MSAAGWNAKVLGADEVAPTMRHAVELGTQKGLEYLGVKGAEIVQENIATPYNGKPPAVAFGNLLSAIVPSYIREATMQREVIGVEPSVQANVYAAPVETGTRPHMPPPSALVPWVMQRLEVKDEKQATSLAFAIAKTIAKRGTSGHEMFSRALPTLESMAPDALEAYIGAALAEEGFAFCIRWPQLPPCSPACSPSRV